MLRVLLFFMFSFLAVTRQSVSLPISTTRRYEAPSKHSNHFRKKFRCKFARFDDFFACNCLFLAREGHSALLPKQVLSPFVLSGAIESCHHEFGDERDLVRACNRLRVCGDYKKTRVCTRQAKGMRFMKRKTISAMRRFRRDCVREI